jgi:hypothetical protein
MELLVCGPSAIEADIMPSHLRKSPLDAVSAHNIVLGLNSSLLRQQEQEETQHENA